MARVVGSVVIAGVAAGGITLLVSGLIRRSDDRPTRKPTVPGAMFVVGARSWQSKVLGGTGLLFVATGIVLVTLSIVLGGSSAGAGIPGVIIALGGGVFGLLAWRMARLRLEVVPGAIWVIRPGGARHQVLVSDISKLSPLTSNRYGGIVARVQGRKVFSANRLMLGYDQLINYLSTRRPDLPIGEESLPL